MSNPIQKHVTVQHAAQCLGVTVRHIYRLIQLGHLSAINISATGTSNPYSLRVAENSIDDFIKARTIDPEKYCE